MPKKYSNEYREYLLSPQWRVRANKCLKMSKNKCVLTGAKATHTHHLSYNNLKHEWIVRDVVPLSPSAHKFVHIPLFWNTPIRVLVNWLLRFLYIVKIVFR